MKTKYTIALHSDPKVFAIMYPQRVPALLLPVVHQEFERIKGLGVIQEVDNKTQRCALMVVAREKNDSLRICRDYAEPNNQIFCERVTMPTVEMLARPVQARVFSKLDANSGYWQVPLVPTSCQLTTFIMPVRRFIFKRLPFGIATPPEFFQREMLRILEATQDQVCHMGNILVF